MKLLVPVSILGMPGAGKSHYGKWLSRQWGVQFVDLDHVIENQIGVTIDEFWAEQNEEGFRSVERSVLLSQFLNEPAIISLGGGTPAFLDNMFIIQYFSFSIWLKTPVSILNERILKAPRPVFMDLMEIPSKLQKLQETRYPYYERSSFICDTDPCEPMGLENVTSYCLQHGIITE